MTTAIADRGGQTPVPRGLTLLASEPLAASDNEPPAIHPDILTHHRRGDDIDWSDRDAGVSYLVDAWRLQSGSAHAFDSAAIRALAEADFDCASNPCSRFNHALLKGGDICATGSIAKSHLVTVHGTGHELHSADGPVMLDASIPCAEPRHAALVPVS